MGVKPFLKLAGSIRAQPQPLCGLPDIRPVKGGRLEKDRFHLIGNLTVFAAHNACNADFLFPVAYHQDIFIQLPYLFIQGLEFLPILCAADNDFMPCYCV